MNEEEVKPASLAAPVPENKLTPYFRFVSEHISDIIFILDVEGRFREINPSFERYYGYNQAEIQGTALENLIKEEEFPTYAEFFSQLLKLPGQSRPFDLHIRACNGEYRDLTGNMTNMLADPSIDGLLVIASDTTEQRRWEVILGQYSHRLEVLRKIQSGLLQAESPETISRAALDHIRSIIPSSLASVTLFDSSSKRIHLLASLGNVTSEPPPDTLEQIDEIQAVLKMGDWFEVEDAGVWTERSPLFQMLATMGIKRIFFIPILIRGDLIGSLSLGFLPDENVRLDHLEAAREIADMLALAIQQSRLLASEQRQRQQAELIRDAISSIATSLNFHKIMSDLLSSLRLLVTYDSARVVLIEEDALRVAGGAGFNPSIEITGKRYSKDNKIFLKMLKTELPVIISDTRKEKCFTPWDGQKDFRGWIGIPLISHNGMIGYLSLSSYRPGAFDKSDLAPILVFADHVAVTLENAWLYDETVRRAKELGAIARVSTSLRKAGTLQELMKILIEKTLEGIEVRHGFIYQIEGNEMILSAAVGPAERWLGRRTSTKDDPLVSILLEGPSVTLSKELDPSLLKAWKKGRTYAGKDGNLAFVPLRTMDGLVGLMCLNLEETGEIDLDRLKIVESIADMASNALYRVMMMGQLENRVADQTRDLTILYEVSSITSQALELEEMLSLSLDRMLSFTSNSLAVVYQLQNNDTQMVRLVERRYPVRLGGSSSASAIIGSETAEETAVLPDMISGDEILFFSNPLDSGIPQLIPDLTVISHLPSGFVRPDLAGYVGIPIRSKGHALGMLCLFSKSCMNISIEQITLLSAVGDQLGVAIDSQRLRQRAAKAALFEERQRLARDLHDSVTQSLYSLTLLAEGYRRQVPTGSLSDIQSWLADLESVSLQALKEMRLLLYELKPATFQEDGLMDALQRRLQSVESRSGMKVDFLVEPQTNIPIHYQENLYRIAQEALNNILKHSGADAVQIHLGNREGNIFLEIHDNGKGFSPEAAVNAGGFGLAGMAERVKDLGGNFEIQSTTDSGTRIRVLIPGGSE